EPRAGPAAEPGNRQRRLRPAPRQAGPGWSGGQDSPAAPDSSTVSRRLLPRRVVERRVARDFEELAEGEVSVSAARVITESDVRQFADLTGDHNALHLSEAFARTTRFGRCIAHGALVFSVSIGLLQSDEPRGPRILGFLGVENLRFAAPVFPGDAIRV